jgi:hypothetical protein
VKQSPLPIRKEGGKDGRACIGLGGIWSFKCKRTGEFEIRDELKNAVNW